MDPEYIALTSCYPTLVSCIQQSPNSIADMLIERLAPKTIQDLRNPYLNPDDKARAILDAVLTQVKRDRSVFDIFTKALRDAGQWTREVVYELEQTYTSLLDNCKQTQSSATFYHQSGDTSLNPYTGSGPYRMTSCPDENETGPLGVNLSQIRGRFAILQIKVLEAIEKQMVGIKRFATFLQTIKATDIPTTTAYQGCLLTPDTIHEVKTQCKDVDDLFTILEQGYYSWFNFELIEEIVNAFCYEDATVCSELARYQLLVREHCEITLSENEFGVLRDGTVSCVFKINKQQDTISFITLTVIKQTICEILKLTRVALFLQSARSKDCIELMYDLPVHVAQALFPLSQHQLEALEKQDIFYCGKSWLQNGE